MVLIARTAKLEIELHDSSWVGGFADQFVSVIKEDFATHGLSASTCANSNFRRCSPKINQRDFQAYMMLGWSSGIESDPFQLWHTSQREKGHNFTWLR
jgi:peptide/nickel transport system substrate-binding protein